MCSKFYSSSGAEIICTYITHRFPVALLIAKCDLNLAGNLVLTTELKT